MTAIASVPVIPAKAGIHLALCATGRGRHHFLRETFRQTS
jgi:hypothetical protein